MKFMGSLECPNCGKAKKAWFKMCWDCSEKEKQKPSCEVCGKETPEGHTLCKEHWLEKRDAKKNIESVEYVKEKKNKEFKEKFEGKYYFNSQKVKSKSELLICYFLTANKIIFQYEPPMDFEGNEQRPDFVIDDGKGNFIILEHFGLDDKEYVERRKKKCKNYEDFCAKSDEFHFISTVENDIYDLKERLGKKLNETPLKRVMWK
jgi:hypothetical protein